MITLDQLKRCARERDLFLKKVDQCILEEGVSSIDHDSEHVDAHLIKDYLDRL